VEGSDEITDPPQVCLNPEMFEEMFHQNEEMGLGGRQALVEIGARPKILTDLVSGASKRRIRCAPVQIEAHIHDSGDISVGEGEGR